MLVFSPLLVKIKIMDLTDIIGLLEITRFDVFKVFSSTYAERIRPKRNSSSSSISQPMTMTKK